MTQIMPGWAGRSKCCQLQEPLILAAGYPEGRIRPVLNPAAAAPLQRCHRPVHMIDAQHQFPLGICAQGLLQAGRDRSVRLPRRQDQAQKAQLQRGGMKMR